MSLQSALRVVCYMILKSNFFDLRSKLLIIRKDGNWDLVLDNSFCYTRSIDALARLEGERQSFMSCRFGTCVADICLDDIFGGHAQIVHS